MIALASPDTYLLAKKIYEDLKSLGIDVEQKRLEMVAS